METRDTEQKEITEKFINQALAGAGPPASGRDAGGN